MAQGFTQYYANPTGVAGGDLSGTYPSPTVTKINGVALGSTTATNTNILMANGTQWVSTAQTSITSVGTLTAGTWNATVIGVIYGGTGLTTATQGDIIYASAANTWTKLAKDTNATRYLANSGTSNNPAWAQVDLTNGVTGTLAKTNGGAGVTSFDLVIQRLSTYTATVGTTTTSIPFDNTIPQNTEGSQFMTQAITPSSSSSILVIEVAATVSHSGAGPAVAVALFQDSTANALATAVMTISTANGPLSTYLKYTMTAGTTSSTTFKVRIGASTGSTVTFNGSAGAGLYNGTLASFISVTEYQS